MMNNREDVEKAGIYILELDGTDDIDPHIVYGDSETPEETYENSNSKKTDEPTKKTFMNNMLRNNIFCL